MFEGFGPVGERRDKDLAGHAVDAGAVFPDGSQGSGIDGLKRYLHDRRQDDFVDKLWRKLLAYALGRSLTLTWATPAGTTTPHVASVTTDAAVPGVPATAATWTYGYSGDLLTQVCPPTSTTACTTYTYGTTTRYPNMVANLGPRSYWRLGDPAASTVATSAVADNGGTDAGSYVSVTLAQSTGPLAGSTATYGSFNGTTSAITLPRTALRMNPSQNPV